MRPKTRHPTRAAALAAAALSAAIIPALASPAHAQRPDSVTVVAGARYEAGALQRALLGSRWRDVWLTPARIEVLDLQTFAGGLTPVRTGGNVQTIALRLKGADGREYNFRSVDKELTPSFPPFARNTLADWLRQDQTSAQHPGSTVVATALLDAAGILNPGPRLVVMPDDPALGEFRAQYAGMLGTIEVHADEGEDDQGLFHGFPDVDNTEDVLEKVEEEGPEHRIDARGYLRARLVDMLVGDWDRHEGQWRWARRDTGGVHVWVPVPEDRDYAFVDHDGVLLDGARNALTNRVLEFEPGYPTPYALMANSVEMNRRLLAELPREAWEREAAELRALFTDATIARAVDRLPPEWRAVSGDRLERILRARRDRLPDIAVETYRFLAEAPQVYATDQDERADVIRREDGSVTVLLTDVEDDPDAEPYFRRTFVPGETDEVRIYLRGGDDLALVRGAGGPIVVRIVGGGGDDRLEDRGAGRTVFYDARGENTFVRGPNTRVDEREWDEPEEERVLLPVVHRDWGSKLSLVALSGDWEPNVGPVVGVGPKWTRWGFRHHPHAAESHLRALWAPLETRFGVEYEGEYRPENSPHRLEAFATATEIPVVRFHGFGNESVERPSEVAEVRQRLARAEALWVRVPREGLELGIGPAVTYVEASPAEGSPADLFFGAEEAGYAGVVAALERDARDDEVFPRRGWRLRARAEGYPLAWADAGAFARTEGRASAYLPLPLRSVLAARVAGEWVTGDFPLREAAFLGGRRTLRGFSGQRFAGDALVAGGAEVRVPVVRANLGLRGDLGVSAFADAGRVWLDGDSPGSWHTAAGGGVWFATPVFAGGVYFARGEDDRVYLQLGMPF